MPTVTIEQVPEGQERAGMWIARFPGEDALRIMGGRRDIVERTAQYEASQRSPGEAIEFAEVPWVFRPEEVEPPAPPSVEESPVE